MPSPKAVLRDIADNDLDPEKAHKKCATNGRLRPPMSTAQPAKPALVRLPEEPKAEKIVPSTKVETKEEPVQKKSEATSKVEEKPVVKKTEPAKKEVAKVEASSDAKANKPAS